MNINPLRSFEGFSGSHKRQKQRMRRMRTGAPFRVKLGGDEKGVVRIFQDLHNALIRRRTSEDQTGSFDHIFIHIIKFVAVPEAFVRQDRAVELAHLCSRLQLHIIAPDALPNLASDSGKRLSER